jgi:hypothetical protein
MDLQEMSDRLEVYDLLARYSWCIDSRDWDGLTPLFTDDAHLDYTATGGIAGTLPEQQAYFAQVLPMFKGSQHLSGTTTFDFSDAAGPDGVLRTRTICLNPMVCDDKDTYFVGLWYVDELRRVDGSWRFARRVEEQSWTFHTARR